MALEMVSGAFLLGSKMRALRIAEVIHRFDDALSEFNQKYKTKYYFRDIDKSDTELEILDENANRLKLLEFKTVFNAMHLSSKKRYRFVSGLFKPPISPPTSKPTGG